MISHIKLWNGWRKHNCNSKLHKFLVLIGIDVSPTFEAYKSSNNFREFVMEHNVEISESISSFISEMLNDEAMVEKILKGEEDGND